MIILITASLADSYCEIVLSDDWMTPAVRTFQMRLEPKHTRPVINVTLIRTDTTRQSAQAQAQGTVTENKKNNKLCGDMPTLPLGLIVPDGREAAFFYSLAVELLAQTIYRFSAGAYALTAWITPDMSD